MTTGKCYVLNIQPPDCFKFLVQLTLLHNHSGKNVEYYLNFQSETDRFRWIEAIEIPKSEDPNEKIYEEWDCPQVQCIQAYTAQQPDELSLEESEVVNVVRKLNEWFEGESLKDGRKGWFPSNCTQEVINKHVRARNLRKRHRLMMLTESFMMEQQKEQRKSNSDLPNQRTKPIPSKI